MKTVQQQPREYTQQQKKGHARSSFLSDFILGWQDGLVNVLGIVLGLSAAGQHLHIIFIAGLAALGAESISMGAVAYTSTSARRRLYQSEINHEKREMKDSPTTEQEEVRDIFRQWGYRGKELEDLTSRISANPKAMLELMMSYEHKLAPVEESQPRRSFLLVVTSTVLGSFVPLLPFFFVGENVITGAIGAVLISAVTLFFIGWYEAKTTVGSLWKSGLQLTGIGLAAGLAGFLIGHLIGGV